MAIEKTFADSRLTQLLDTWHRVAVSIDTYTYHYNDMLVWCLENSEGKFYKGNSTLMYFQLEKDATLFALKWGSK